LEIRRRECVQLLTRIPSPLAFNNNLIGRMACCYKRHMCCKKQLCCETRLSLVAICCDEPQAFVVVTVVLHSTANIHV
jgi:hypothetical protein